MAFIRPYEKSDFDACANICIETLSPTLAASSPAATRLTPYIWTHPYTFLSPSTCHVLDDGTGKAVGYCSCPNVQTFVDSYPLYEKAILSTAIERPSFATREPWLEPSAPNNTDNNPGQDGDASPKVNPLALAQCAYRADWMLLENKEALTSRWRATMHIDLLPAWQGAGWGRRLIHRFIASVQRSELDYGEGEHIGVSGENSKVVPFYEKLGFRLVDGGEREGNIWMVRDFTRL